MLGKFRDAVATAMATPAERQASLQTAETAYRDAALVAAEQDDDRGLSRARGAVQDAKDRLRDAETALAAMRLRIASEEARQQADAEAQRWDEARTIAAQLEQRGRELDSMLTAASEVWLEMTKLSTDLAAVAPVDVRDVVGQSARELAFDRSLEAARLPSRSNYRGMFGSAATIPGTATALGEEARAYLASRQPQQDAAAVA